MEVQKIQIFKHKINPKTGKIEKKEKIIVEEDKDVKPDTERVL